jgi:hypothetical protein
VDHHARDVLREHGDDVGRVEQRHDRNGVGAQPVAVVDVEHDQRNERANIAGTWNSWLVKGPVYAKPLALPVETDDERAARVQAAYERNQAWERERKIAAEQRRVAIGKADKLLESVLSHVQREQLRKDEAFLVRGQSGKVYRVRKGRGINVDEIALETGDVVRTLCAYPGINVPDGDTMAAQKLMLEADEADFLAIAIKHQARGPKVERAALDALLESLA